MVALDQVRLDQVRTASAQRSDSRSESNSSRATGGADQSASPSAIQNSDSQPAQSFAPNQGEGAPARIPAGGFFISPNLTFDSRASTVIFQIRDAESGDVTRQFPAETVVERYRRDPSLQPFVLPEPAGEPAEDDLAPRINNQEPSDPAEVELATGPSGETGPDGVGQTNQSTLPPETSFGAPTVSSQLAPVDIVA